MKDAIRMMARVDEDGFVYEATAEGCGGNPWQGGRRTEDDSLPDAEPIRVSDRDHFRALVAENAAGEPKVIVSGLFIPRGAPLALCLAAPRGAMLASSRAMLAGAASAFLLMAIAAAAGMALPYGRRSPP